MDLATKHSKTHLIHELVSHPKKEYVRVHPIILLLIAGGGAYLLWDTMDDAPEVQSLRNPKNNTQVVVPTGGPTPKSGVSAVPIPPNQGPQAIHQPLMPKSGPNLHPRMPAIITASGATNFTMQTVEDIQRAMNAIGAAVPPLRVDGTLNPATMRAIVAVQKLVKIPPTGVPDLVTRRAVETTLGNMAIGDPPGIGSSPVVQHANIRMVEKVVKSASQLAVKSSEDIQRALNALGSNPALKVDGIIGPKTEAAIKAFQIATGLVADGVAGPKTIVALQTAVDPIAYRAVQGDKASATYAGENTPYDFGGKKKKKGMAKLGMNIG
jgi:peptidoglycan hydrolase-like protein with peptidoglycan-binding domain